MTEETPKRFVPINDRILLRVVEGEKKSAGGIFLPIEHVTAKVVAAGPGAIVPIHHPQAPFFRQPPTVKPGDTVALPKRYKEHCEEVLHEGVLHYVATENVILGILEG